MSCASTAPSASTQSDDMNEAVNTIPAVLHQAARQFPDAEAVVDGARRLTFTELEADAVAVARALIASGVEPGDRVAIWAPNSGTWIVASFGVYLAGAVLVPLNTRYKGDEAGHILRTSGAKLLLTVTDFLDTDYVAMLADVPDMDALKEIVVLSGPAPGGTVGWGTFVGRCDGVAPSAVEEREQGLNAESTSD